MRTELERELGSGVGEVARQFAIEGELVGVRPYGSGHINDTFCVEFDERAGRTRTSLERVRLQRIILQRINGRVFKNPAALMENIERVTAHLAAKVAGQPDAERRAMRLVPTRDGRAWHVDWDNRMWRAYRFIGGARSFDVVERPEQAFEAARAFGRFQQMLVDLPGPRLVDTIPDFHNTPMRFRTLERVIAEDAAGRVKLAAAEIGFLLKREAVMGALVDAGLPERVTHNDTKCNNVMLDETTGEGICVIDLDTVMPGWSLCDFGDMVRTATSGAAEDDRDLTKVGMRFEMFEALARGYLEAAGGFLTKDEIGLLTVAGKVITLEQGLRFLTDYLAGDVYYKVAREGHNLDRCRTQIRLVESIEAQQTRMERLVGEIAL